MTTDDSSEILQRLTSIETKLDLTRGQETRISKLEQWRSGLAAAFVLLAFEVQVAAVVIAVVKL